MRKRKKKLPEIKMTVTQVPIVARTRKLAASFSLEPNTITYKYKDKTFALLPTSKELADRLVTLELKDWVQYLQYDKDPGIVQLVKCLCGMKFREDTGNEMIFHISKEVEEELAKQIAEEIDKELLEKMNNMSISNMPFTTKLENNKEAELLQFFSKHWGLPERK